MYITKFKKIVTLNVTKIFAFRLEIDRKHFGLKPEPGLTLARLTTLLRLCPMLCRRHWGVLLWRLRLGFTLLMFQQQVVNNKLRVFRADLRE